MKKVLLTLCLLCSINLLFGQAQDTVKIENHEMYMYSEGYVCTEKIYGTCIKYEHILFAPQSKVWGDHLESRNLFWANYIEVNGKDEFYNKYNTCK